MTWRRVLVVMVLAGCALAMAGCGGSDPGTALSTEDWVTFEGEYVSLKLPDYFVGGDPTDPSAVAALHERVTVPLDPTDASEMTLFLRGFPESVRQPGDSSVVPARRLVLFVCGEPDDKGFLPIVAVWRFRLHAVASARGDDSMQFLAEQVIMPFQPSEWTVEVLAPDRAYVVFREASSASGRTVWSEQVVIEIAGDYLYSFTYTHWEEQNTALEAIFAASAKTATVKGYD